MAIKRQNLPRKDHAIRLYIIDDLAKEKETAAKQHR